MRPTAFTGRMGVQHPLVLAPMAGGPSTPALCSAVSEAGGLGSHGGAYVAPAKLREEIRAIRAATSRPFAVNLFADDGVAAEERALRAAQDATAKYRTELGLPPPGPPLPSIGLREAFPVLLEERVPVFSFTFGLPPREMLDACRKSGILTKGTATTVAEARALEQAGVGVMDGRGFAAALVLGASAVSLGTAFLRCPEAGTSSPYRAALREARDDSTVITRAFSGRAARGLGHRFTRAMSGEPLAPFAAQNALTREIRAAAAKAGDAGLLSLWAGQGAPLMREEPARELVARILREADAVIARL